MTLFGLWGEAEKVHMALLQDAEIVVVTINARTASSVGRTGASAAIRLERAIHDLCGSIARPSRPAALARSWRWGRKPHLSSGRSAFDFHDVSIFAVRGRKPAPDRGWSGACRYHRARSFPLHVNGEAVVRLEQRLATFIRVSDRSWPEPRSRRRPLAGALPATARSRTHLRLRMQSKLPEARFRRAVFCAPDGRARTARQSLRRHGAVCTTLSS